MSYVGFAAERLGGGLVGGSFLRQAESVEAGVPVPASLVVGRVAWDEWLEAIRPELEERVFRMGSLKDDALELECEALRRWLESQPLPGLLMVEIEKAAAMLYRDANGLDQLAGAVAVSIELMASPERAFVLFTGNSEILPGITLPLTFTFTRGFYREAFTDCLRQLGVNDAELEAHRHDLDRMIGYHDGRVYHRISTLNELFSIPSLSPLYRTHLLAMFDLDTAESQTAPVETASLGQRLQQQAQLWRGLAHMLRNHPHLESKFENFSTQFRSDLAAFEREPISELSAPDALERLRAFTDLAFRRWGVTLVNDTCASLGTELLEKLFERWSLSESDPDLLSNLMQDEELASSRTLHHLVSLASELHADADLFALFETNPPDRVWQRLRRDPDHVRFFGRVKHHLHAFGHRRPDELKLESPALRNDPSPLLKLIHQYAKKGITTHEIRTDRQATRDSAETRLDALTRRHPIRRRLVRMVLEITRRSVANQEEARHLRSQLFGAARNALAIIGQKLAIDGALREPSDIHYISIDELDDAIEGTLVSDDVDSLVALRRNQVALYRKRHPAPQFVTIGPIHRDLTGKHPDPSTDHRRAA